MKKQSSCISELPLDVTAISWKKNGIIKFLASQAGTKYKYL
jgi:hypothetical protein